MKKISAFICVNLWLILLCFSAFAQDFKTVRDGIEYAEMTRQIDNAPVKMNLLKLDLTKVRLDVVHAMDAAIGTETTSSMATRHGAFAAINGGFFRLDKSIFAGDETGVLVIDNWHYSESIAGRIALMISNQKDKTEIFIEKANILTFLIAKGIDITVGVNRSREKDDAVIYTKVFPRSTLSDNDGVEFLIQREEVKRIFDKRGNNEILCDGYILSASGKRREELLKLLRIGTKIKMRTAVSSPVLMEPPSFAYGKSEDIIGGVPQLIKNGEVEITWQEEKQSKEFVETKHPRTAAAKLKDGKFLMMTVDGRSEESGGIGLEDLAKILLELGATDAMNLDGGGSTTMFLDGKIVNKPSDKEGERRVGDAILVTPRK